MGKYRSFIFCSLGLVCLLLVPFAHANPQYANSPKLAPQQSQTQSYYSATAKHTYLGDGKYRYGSKLGTQNIFYGGEYVPYIWFAENQTVKYQSFSLQFFDWYAVFRNSTHVLIDDVRWVVELWQTQAGGRWNTLNLWNHYFYPVEFFDSYLVITQGYDDGQNYMNVSYKCGNTGIKTEIAFLAGEENTIRFYWQLTGISGTEFIAMDSNRTFNFGNVAISLNDTDLSKAFTYEWAVANHK